MNISDYFLFLQPERLTPKKEVTPISPEQVLGRSYKNTVSLINHVSIACVV